MKFTWERIEGKQLWFDVRFADHLPRYKLAQKYCEGKKVLDIACGTGYGSKELAEVASSVIGIDVDKASVELAQKVHKNIYHVSNFTTIHLIDVFKQYFSDFSVKYQGKHLFPFPGRGFWQVLLSWFWVKRDVKIRDEKPSFEHHVTIIVAKK